ncbi:MAG: hypothetical protein U0S36_01590 [Candidatus Nanopelagicales bacterium]
MGIRYYAYAVDAALIEQAVADPRAFISGDPLADAWGLEPHTAISVATFEQRLAHRDLLYLDKAWSDLQLLTRPFPPQEPARPAYRMFEGAVTPALDGYGWEPWVRALRPVEMGPIACDLVELTNAPDALVHPVAGTYGEQLDYVMHHLDKARSFVLDLVRDGRGMAYLIG